MRDVETIGTALACRRNRPHGVLHIAHIGRGETINRIIAVFPPPEQKQIRLQLAAVLRAVVSQRLVKRCDSEGRVPAVEVMINTAYIRECILVPEKTRAVRDAISAGTSQYGMQTFDQSLWDLFQAGLISYEIALENASNADDFKLRMQGVSSSSDISRTKCRQQVSAGVNTDFYQAWQLPRKSEAAFVWAQPKQIPHEKFFIGQTPVLSRLLARSGRMRAVQSPYHVLMLSRCYCALNSTSYLPAS